MQDSRLDRMIKATPKHKQAALKARLGVLVKKG